MRRLGSALVHEFVLQYRNIVIAALAISGAMLLFSLLAWLGGVEPVDLWSAYQGVVVIMGVLISSAQFSELRSPGHRIAFLLRPATVWEKVAAKTIIAVGLVWLALTVAFLIASLLGAVLYLVMVSGADAGQVFSLSFAGGRWLRISAEALASYLPLHAIFLFGSVYFRRHALGATLLAIVGWIGSYAILSVVMLRIVFARYVTGDYPGRGNARAFGFELRQGQSLSLSGEVWQEIVPGFLRNPELLETVFTVLTVVVFWLLAVNRLRETEG